MRKWNAIVVLRAFALAKCKQPSAVQKTAFAIEKPAIKDYLRLGKHKLTGFIVLTALSGYSLGFSAAVPAINANWPTQLSCLVVGTALCSFSAASLNQLFEVPYDFQMPRTQNRPLTAHKIPLRKAFAFSIATAVSGVGILAAGTTIVTSALGAGNLVLYAFVYTPFKRISRWNTWIGAVVGAIPPLMGWTACGSAVNCTSLLLPALLYCWQFPHFFALSWNLRKEYSRAGYEMLTVLHPEKSTLVALRYSLVIPVISGMSYWFGVGGAKFLACALVLDAGLVWNAVRFWAKTSSVNAKRLFFASLVHLPVYLAALSASSSW